MTIHAAWLTLHLLAAAFWVGGMATMHFAVRPAVAAVLIAPPQRLALMAAVLQRFFAGVSAAVVLLLVSGLAMIFGSGGFGAQRPGVHTMFALALVMMALFGHIRFALYPRLQRALAAGTLPVAAAALNGIRRSVAVNLALGVLVFAVALLWR